ncbi:MAG: DUF350 domain-containing protein [Elusimicrobiales bacterium]
MFIMKLAVSLFELLLMAAASGLVIYITYRVFVRANPDFDMEEEIKRGNTAVGILMAAILVSASMMLERGLSSVVSLFRLQLYSQPETAFPVWKSGLLMLGHMALALAIAVFTISFTLRLFGRVSRWHRPDFRPGAELQRGNVAVGILLAAVVLVAGLYVAEGVSALTKALIPQPPVGQIHIMR